MTSARKVIDWEAVELQYRAGIRSLKDIGREFGVSDAGILKRAKRDGWVRDLKAKILAKADAKVSASLVSGVVSAQTRVAESEVVEAEATAVAQVRLSQRKDIGRARTLTVTLLEELEAVTTERLTVESLQDLLDRAANPDNDEARQKILDKARDALNKAISLPARAGTIKALSDSLKTLVTLEREAWGLKTESTVELTVKNGGANNADSLTDEQLAIIALRGRPAPTEPEASTG